MPSTRYAEIAPRVRENLRALRTPYNTGPCGLGDKDALHCEERGWPIRAGAIGTAIEQHARSRACGCVNSVPLEIAVFWGTTRFLHPTAPLPVAPTLSPATRRSDKGTPRA
jgi:hypothetical protein